MNYLQASSAAKRDTMGVRIGYAPIQVAALDRIEHLNLRPTLGHVKGFKKSVIKIARQNEGPGNRV
jgi:hypothetical protein